MSKRPAGQQAADDAALTKRRRSSGRSGSAGKSGSLGSVSRTSYSGRGASGRTGCSVDDAVKILQPNPAVPTTLQFNSGVVTCEICCNDALACSAVRFACRHGWYCSTCITKHAQARLNAGAMDVQCPECREHIQECDLKQLLSKDTISRFQARSLEQAVASSPNLYVCPTPNCTMCVEVEDGEDPWLESCPLCKKSSCLQCGAQPYHRGVSCDDHARSRKDKQAEDSLLRWMQKTGAKQCPQCKIAVTKEHLESQSTQYRECHKMLCRSCGTKFCFKCLAVLTDTYTCGCSIDGHGFVDPVTGERIEHLRPQCTKGRGKPPKKQRDSRAEQHNSGGRGRGRSKK